MEIDFRQIESGIMIRNAEHTIPPINCCSINPSKQLNAID